MFKYVIKRNANPHSSSQDSCKYSSKALQHPKGDPRDPPMKCLGGFAIKNTYSGGVVPWAAGWGDVPWAAGGGVVLVGNDGVWVG